MQSILDWIVSHSAILIFAVYELWSLIPEATVKSSSILTWLGEFLKSEKDKNPVK